MWKNKALIRDVVAVTRGDLFAMGSRQEEGGECVQYHDVKLYMQVALKEHLNGALSTHLEFCIQG